MLQTTAFSGASGAAPAPPTAGLPPVRRQVWQGVPHLLRLAGPRRPLAVPRWAAGPPGAPLPAAGPQGWPPACAAGCIAVIAASRTVLPACLQASCRVGRGCAGGWRAGDPPAASLRGRLLAAIAWPLLFYICSEPWLPLSHFAAQSQHACQAGAKFVPNAETRSFADRNTLAPVRHAPITST